MRKKVIAILIVLLGLGLLYIGINLFDIDQPTSKYKLTDIPEATLNYNNGYYRLWTLTSPPGTDIHSEAELIKYRRTADPNMNPDKYIKEFDGEGYKSQYDPFKKIYKEANLKLPTEGYTEDWGLYILSRKEDIRRLEKDLALLQERYKELIECKVFEDFIMVRPDSPIPNLLAWLHTAKLYIAINMLDAMEGNWEKGVTNLLDHLDFGKRSIKGSRALITNLIGKAVTRYSAKALASLMNQKDCPKEVFQMILDRTPPIAYEEYGSRPSLIGEGWYWAPLFTEVLKETTTEIPVLDSIFFHKNRIKEIHFRIMEKIIKYEETSPYLWEEDMNVPKSFCDGWFWWLRNPRGKMWLDKNIKYENFLATVLKSYFVRTTYEMTHISAELHLNYSADRSVQEILNGLDSYKRNPDPCSGKPYLWDDSKQVLYSIGTDRTDDKAVEQRHTLKGDFVLPVILYLK